MQALREYQLTDADYELFRRLVYDETGINLGDHKQQLLRARLAKRLRNGDFASFRAYYEFVKHDSSGTELLTLIDAVSTNTTHLFRERQHFDFLARTLGARLNDRRARSALRDLRIWSAGCSAGDEPYSIAMTVDDVVGTTALDWRILATDVSTKILERAKAGLYEVHRLETVPAPFRTRYFASVRDTKPPQARVCPALRERIRFARLNLVRDTFPFRHGFDYIFCRNVMIYFDRPTQQALVAKLAAQLRPGGHLLIGHSESLNGIAHPLQYVEPTIYRMAGP